MLQIVHISANTFLCVGCSLPCINHLNYGNIFVFVFIIFLKRIRYGTARIKFRMYISNDLVILCPTVYQWLFKYQVSTV